VSPARIAGPLPSSRSATSRRVDSGFVAARKAIVFDSTEAEGWFALGDLLVYPEKYSDARRAYLKALELRPGHSGAMADLANVYVALGRYDEALDWALRSQEVNPTHPHGWYHVGLPLLPLADAATTERYLLSGDKKFPGQFPHPVHARLARYAPRQEPGSHCASEAAGQKRPG